jgi:CheY-like chemotaxis protein
MMPEMDGVTFFHRLRDLCPDAVRIMLSGRLMSAS